MQISLNINGVPQTLAVEPRRTLLDALRHDLQLTGTKKVCDMGNCGACTVLVDGRAMYACLRLAVDCADCEITTIEGVAHNGELDPVQQAFLDADAYQCGFCTAGQIMSLKALLKETPAPDDAQILRAVSGNLCRCGAYRNILLAGQLAAGRGQETLAQRAKEGVHADSTH
ncbi:MAG: (2Fe-2S)-binding protein [Caldilineaceae bacterium]